MGTWEEDKANPGFLAPRISSFYMSIACNHCEAPVCEEACPVAAITKDPDDGRVLINPDICVGCKLCQCCPYDAPQFNEQLGIMRSEEHTSELPSLMRISYAVFCLYKQILANTQPN